MILFICLLCVFCFLVYKRKYQVKEFIFNFRMRCQRFVKGYADVDVWNMSEVFKERTIAMLKDLRKNHHGFPGTEEVPTDEKWCEILDRMIYCFEESLENKECAVKNPYQKEYDERLDRIIYNKNKDVLKDFINDHSWVHEKEYFKYEKKVWAYKKKMENEGLKLFSKYFAYLWD